MQQHWVFAYGSLMWDPGFPVAETVGARLDGYARRFCLRSVVHRGTALAPGLVLGLDAEDAQHCQGLALRVADADWDVTLRELRARELVTNAYEEQILPLSLTDGRQVSAVCYLIRRDHDQYAGGMALDAQAQIIAAAHGARGPNADYLFNTSQHLAGLGIRDAEIDWLAGRVRGLIGKGGQ